MSTLEEFVEERRTQPWPTRGGNAGVPAKALYDAYVAYCNDRGERPLPMQSSGQQSFGARLLAMPGITKDRVETGNVYYGIAIETRMERARQEVMYGDLPGDPSIYREEYTRLHQAHADRNHGGRRANCTCNLAGLWAKAREATEARPDIDQRVREFLEPRPGIDPALQAAIDDGMAKFFGKQPGGEAGWLARLKDQVTGDAVAVAGQPRRVADQSVEDDW